MLLVGQLLWPILILAMLIQKKIFFITLKEFPILKGAFYTFLFVIFLLTFFGGTHRHYYPFIPNLLLILPLMLANRNKSWISFAKIPMILITSLLILYLVVKTFL
jgi:hypothetical protein